MKKRTKFLYFMTGLLAGVMIMTATAAFASGGSMIEVFYNVRGIYIDGELKPTPDEMTPFLFKGWTFVPLRFVSENLGSKIDWDPVTNTVHITGGTKAPAAGEDPIVMSVTASKTSVEPGDTISVTVNANKNTFGVSLMDENLNSFGTSNIFVESGETRIFTVTCAIPADFSGSRRIYAHGIDSTNVINSNPLFSKDFTVSVQQSLAINSMAANRTTVAVSADATITVKTNASVDKVKLTNNNNNDVNESTNFTSSNNERVFTFTVTHNRTGTIRYTATAGSTSGGYDDNVTKTVDVRYGETSGQTTTAGNMDIKISNSGSSHKEISVTTYDDVFSVEFQNNSGNMIERTNTSSVVSGGKKNWIIRVPNSNFSSSEQRFYVEVFLTEDYKDSITSKDIMISINTNNEANPNELIYNFYYSNEGLNIGNGQTVFIEFETDALIGGNDIMITFSNTPLSTVKATASNNNRKWRVEFTPENDKRGSYSLVIRYNNQNVTAKTFTID